MNKLIGLLMIMMLGVVFSSFAQDQPTPVKQEVVTVNFILSPTDVIASTASVRKGIEIKVVEEINVKFSYFKISAVGIIPIVEHHKIKVSNYDEFLNTWFKQHNATKKMSSCCTVRYDEDTCSCIQRCCFWGGIGLGEVCVEQTVECVGSPEDPCD